MSEAFFKQCKICQVRWESRDDFISDREIVLIGYQANIIFIEKGLFLFNHSCGGTMGVKVQYFADLYDGPIYQEQKNATEDCPGYCLYRDNLTPCPAKCNCAYVREILHLLKDC